MDKTTIYLPRDLHDELKAMARRTGRPQAELIREAVESFVARQERPRPRIIGMVEKDMVGAADVEDWLGENWKPDW
jgi:predicted transcriptional regulator